MTDTPTTASEAAARLSTLTATPEWGQKLMARDVATVKEFNDLTGLVASADTAAEALAGKFTSPSTADAHVLGVGVEQLRQIGLGDDEIKQAIDGTPVSQEEKAAVQRLMAQRKSDEGWVERLLKKDFDTYRELTRMSLVLSAPVKQETA